MPFITEHKAADRPALTIVPSQAATWRLDLPATLPASRHPALVYLARLAPSSRRVQRVALDRIAAALTAGRCDTLSLDWAAVRYEHATAARAVLLSAGGTSGSARGQGREQRGDVRAERFELGAIQIGRRHKRGF